jgi:predicted P-loop ATPase
MTAPSREEFLAVAIGLWGPVNEAQSTGDEKRFGRKGARWLNLKKLVWENFETGEKGGYVAFYKLAGVPLPNGHDNTAQPGPGAPIAVYLYRDENGPLFEVVRFPNHKFLQRKPDGSWGIKGVRRVPYRLPELVAAASDHPVFIPEGEKDVDNVRALGLVATCNPGGAGKWKRNYSAFLKGRHCVILPDNDAPGRAHADQVIHALNGVAASVRRLELPGLGEKGDVSDWIGAGGTKAQLLELLEATATRTEDDWRSQAMVTDKGHLIPNLANAFLALRHDPHWRQTFSYDEMQVQTLARGLPVQDVDIAVTQKWLQHAGLERIGPEPVRAAIELVAHEHRFHPVRAYLDGLVWDGEPRLHEWLQRYLGAEGSGYHASIGTFFLRSMVARILWPGCKCDYMPVLEGEQGTLKSQACAVLAGGYFSDTLPDLGADHVRLQQHLRGKWLIEVSEMSAFKRAEASKLKAFLTTQVEQYIPKFGRNGVREPRQCVFVGSINKGTYLQDETGGRRFWPVACGVIDLEGLRAARDQLLAEAVVNVKDGDPWWPDRAFEENEARPMQESRYMGDAWEARIIDWDGTIPETDANGKPIYDAPAFPDRGPGTPRRLPLEPPFYLADIAFGALGIPPGNLSKAQEMRLAAVLESLGWKRADKTRKGRPWFPPAGKSP